MPDASIDWSKPVQVQGCDDKWYDAEIVHQDPVTGARLLLWRLIPDSLPIPSWDKQRSAHIRNTPQRHVGFVHLYADGHLSGCINHPNGECTAAPGYDRYECRRLEWEAT